MLLMMRDESFNWSKNRDTKHSNWSIMNGDIVVMYMTGYNVILRMWRWQAQTLRNG
jgi:hypothetical protein